MQYYLILGAIGLVLLLLVFYVLVTYNKLVKGRNRVYTQWAQINVQLKRRADLIPQLMAAVQAYAAHETTALENIAATRNNLALASSPGEAITAGNQLWGQLLPLFARWEAYPDLKANANFIDLQLSLRDTENKITYARQFYNDTVRIYCNMLHQFPSNLVAKLFQFKGESYFSPSNQQINEIINYFQPGD